MAFADYLTAEGERLLAKSIADSVPIVFTKVAMGSGYLPQGVSEKNVSELVTEETTVDVTTVSLNDSSSVVVTAYFNNEALTDGFYFREKGIYMRVGEDEALGIYGNAGSTAEYIDTTDECVIEKVLRTIIQMSSDELKNVQLWNGTAAVAPLIIKDMTLSEFVETDTALTVIAGQQLVIDKTIYVFTGGDQRDIANYTKGVQLSDVYDKQIEGADENGGIGASQNAVYFVHREVEEHTNDQDNPHNVTKEQVGLGNVPNVSTNDQAPTYTEASTLEALKSGEKLSVAFGKIAKAIKDFISHIVTKASSTVLGHVKLTDSSAVTDGTGLALPATEKNASISGTLANQISALNSNLSNKTSLKVLKSDWTKTVGDFFIMYSAEKGIIDFIADINGAYPPIRSSRAYADENGNNINDIYLKKSDANNMFNTNFKHVTGTEYNKYFGNTWSYAGANGLSIDSGTWLVCYYAWFSANSDIEYISLKSTRDEVVGVTAPSSSNGTFLQMQEIISGTAISNLLMFVYVPKSTTFGQVSMKITAIKLR